MPAAAFLRSLLAPARTGLLGLATVVLISGLLALFMIVVVASGAAGTEVATVPVLGEAAAATPSPEPSSEGRGALSSLPMWLKICLAAAATASVVMLIIMRLRRLRSNGDSTGF